jgi:hypothetical protein
MKPLSDETSWPEFAVFDAEAKKWVEIFRVCHMDEFGGKETFDDFDQYLDYVFSPEFGSNIVWSHWGGRYDTRFVISECVKRRYGWHAALSGSLIVILTVTNDIGQKVKFCDSGRLLPDSVRTIGKTIGLPKLEMDRGEMEKYSDAEVEEYCYRDCEIVLRGLQQLRTALMGIGCDFGFTLASIATRHVRRSPALQWHRFYDRKIINGRKTMVYSQDMLDADSYCIAAYFGGRTEAYKISCGPSTGYKMCKYRDLYMYDIRSSYPRSMIEPLPAYFKGFDIPKSKAISYPGRPTVQVQDTQRLLEKCGVSEASIWMPTDPDLFKFPVLPWRNDKATKIVYPLLTNGETGRWTNSELLELWKQGRDHGLRIEVHNQATFEPVAFLRPFIEQFFELRMLAKARGDEFFSYAMKILMNSMYGKLIETTEKRSVLCGEDIIQAAIDKFGEAAIKQSPFPGVYFQFTEEDGPFRHVAAGAEVTALSRLRLLEGIKYARSQGATVYYCDTDSLILDKPVFGKGGSALGDFTLEMEIAEAEFYAAKVYKVTSKTGVVKYKAKGLNISDNTLTDDKFEDEISEERWLAFTAPMRGEDRPTPKREGIYSFTADLKAGRIHPSAYNLPRQMRNSDTKRVHHQDGDSSPLIWNSTGTDNF